VFDTLDNGMGIRPKAQSMWFLALTRLAKVTVISPQDE
jgi:hypothetical protein